MDFLQTHWEVQQITKGCCCRGNKSSCKNIILKVMKFMALQYPLGRQIIRVVKISTKLIYFNLI